MQNFNSTSLCRTHSHGVRQELHDLDQEIRNTPHLRKLIIEGHTDSLGSSLYNLGLSQRRADSIKRYLVQNEKLDVRKIFPIGYGKTKPIADNGNWRGRRKNHRVEFNIYVD